MAAQQADILDRILATKREEIVRLNARYTADELQRLAQNADAPRGFIKALQGKVDQGRAGVIAEVKKASPSKGLIRADFDPAWLAREYAHGGAACLSVLTDEQYFQGHNAFLVQARSACGLPVIRKDFLIDEAQIVEARGLGADCVLLIAAALSATRLKALYDCARQWNMDVLVEVHDTAELELVLGAGLGAGPGDGWLLGINNRNLRTFETRLETTLDMLPRLPAGLNVVTESAIGTRDDVKRMRAAGVQRFLIGESLMRQPRPAAALVELIAE